MIKNLKQFIGILIISLFLGICRYFFIADDYPLFPNLLNKESNLIVHNSIQSIKDFLLDVSESEPELVDIKFAKSIYDYDFGIFVDARDEVDFNEGHITKSLNIPFDVDNNYDFDLLDSLMNEISFNEKSLIVYCSGSGCTLGKDLVYYLYEEHDFYSLVYFEEGYPVWEELNHPTKKALSIKQEKLENKIEVQYSNLDILLLLSIVLIFSFYYIIDLRKYLVPFSRCIVGSIFIYFSYDKIIDPLTFAKLASNYDIIPFNLEYIGALVLPWIEIIVGICLLFGVFIELSTSLSIGMFIFFILMLSQAYLRGKSIDCGCLLNDLNNDSAIEKRMFMLKRIIQDFYFLALTLIIKFKRNSKWNYLKN